VVLPATAVTPAGAAGALKLLTLLEALLLELLMLLELLAPLAPPPPPPPHATKVNRTRKSVLGIRMVNLCLQRQEPYFIDVIICALCSITHQNPEQTRPNFHSQ
jgi:hypothetical protein